MLNTRLGDASANGACNAIAARANGGTLNIYAGSQPANGNTAISSQVLLVSIVLSTPAFSPAVGGVASLNSTSPATAVATGTASFFRIATLLGDQVWDGTIGTSGCDVNFPSTSITVGQPVGVTGFMLAIAEAGN